ncbi:hypothetical protein BBJ28_00000460 [Nothophytophthora sp. Chile5]|nr:hypothetical protein BBJ28_00000460 [Nothophytophthora sp. Chile5]
MHFPLPANTFPPLLVSEEDQLELKKLSTVFIDEALEQYAHFRDVDGGVLDEAHWKVVKSREGVTSYQDRRVVGLDASRAAVKQKVGSGAMTASTKLHGVLAVGAIEGEFNDMIFGLLHPSTEMLKIKSAYTEDKIADAKVLAAIEEPTVADPVRGLYIKWSVSEFAPFLLRKVVRPRDFVYMEAIGIHVTESGERIGYNLLHSLQIPSIRELPDHQIVRGNFSICALFRQKSPGLIELYMKGFVDSMGEIHHSVAVPATAEALMSYRKAVYCGQMKKLNWLVKTKKTVILDHHNSGCVVCTKPVGRRAKCCQVCMNKMCTSCSVSRKLSFLSPVSRRVSQRHMDFCVRCLLAAANADALEIASEEMVRQNPFDVYELSSSSTSSSMPASPSDSILPDITREFFG